MGIILLFFCISETLLPSGIRIIKEDNYSAPRISVGLEIRHGTVLYPTATKLFKERGYNYLYLKNADSLPILIRFLDLLSKDSLFYLKKNHSKMDLLKLVFMDFGGNASPVVNITVGITGRVDEQYIAELFSNIPDSIIPNIHNYYALEPLQGKHIYCGDANIIMNISPQSYEKVFLPFLVCLQIIGNRGFPIDFAPETAPSPFLVHIPGDNIESLFTTPTPEEMKRASNQVYNWMEGQLIRRASMLVLLTLLGINDKKFKEWMEDLQYPDYVQLQMVWERYLMDGFISSATPSLCSLLVRLFPEAEVVK
ncbi:hypothetical protein KAW18_15960 [candidate division WOR-3 bacterium]|nr:hypothetical protein [candidate division WOR-3 bacterium]